MPKIFGQHSFFGSDKYTWFRWHQVYIRDHRNCRYIASHFTHANVLHVSIWDYLRIWCMRPG